MTSTATRVTTSATAIEAPTTAPELVFFDLLPPTGWVAPPVDEPEPDAEVEPEPEPEVVVPEPEPEPEPPVVADGRSKSRARGSAASERAIAVSSLAGTLWLDERWRLDLTTARAVSYAEYAPVRVR
ncbi:uncharacterized protein AMSG_12061 [Thecamonas trahens ATCC 50062]|uniref:Uncharacterized protein n=1 Tax=Thecamonas trahens ATCC 50062 TaxID=461836 RepID=A0A0L0DGG0_THETB|nr:hypothetical protein AMSG_12061 [Thecamonas trahens ATCC 50062]KNC51275.1 hypothetical protein AMSG_12061 [Thecamonas trahens ATCC 50062]|eukprot:XP_013756300.1 hypothetical protein AMSG_12061 [Thecamonas trahens ATCC 50062]